MIQKTAWLAVCLALAAQAKAQLSSNPDKFLGNITTSYNVDYGNEKFYTLWNQITCENESKWASIEGTNNSFNFSGSDRAFNYAKDHGFPFKFHALVWGAQYPNWLESQSPEQRYQEIVQWMDKVKEHYPDLQLIDVVNEAITGHQAGTPYFIEALGGTGKTGYDWLIKAFELAYERWPNAILIYNDFNTFQWNTEQYIDLVKTLRNAGAPIDAYGCQSHDLTDCNFTKFKSSMTQIQNALKMPMYSTEYDIGTSDDNLQLQRYKEQIPYMWEQDYVAGITLWGYIYGRTWTTDGNSGLIRDGKDRPAMTWLREYMQSDEAKAAKSPFPGMKKEASVYIKPSSLNIEKGTSSTITVRAAMRSKTIEKVELYAANQLVATMTAEPYEAEYTPQTIGDVELKAVVTTTDGMTYERYGAVTACNPRAPFRGTPTELPGVLECENFDEGADGIAFHDNNSSKQGTGAGYRNDVTGIDVERGGTGYAIGYGEVGEWMEYTVDVKEAGVYAYDIYYSAPEPGAALSIALSTPEGLTQLTPEQLVLGKTGDWNSYKTAHGRLLLPLEAGKQILRLGITGGTGTYVINIDKITFTHVDINEDIQIALLSDPDEPAIGDATTLTADIQSPVDIHDVKFYADGQLIKTASQPPFEYKFTPTSKRTFHFLAIATDVNGRESAAAEREMTIGAKRVPFVEMTLPGIIEAENFDCGEEGLSFHDSDATDEGNTNYRSDNGGVDIVMGNNSYALGYTSTGEWTEYTVNVTQAGKYNCTSTVSSGVTGSGFVISDVRDGKVVAMWRVSVPQTGNNSWDTYKEVKSNNPKPFEVGLHTIRITIDGSSCNIDKLELKCVEPAAIEAVEASTVATYNVYTLSGALLGQITAEGTHGLNRQLSSLTSNRGMYILENTLSKKTIKVILP